MTRPTKSRPPSLSNPYADSARINALQLMLAAKLDELFGRLGVDLVRSRKLYYGRCPVHGGDNHGALNLYQDGELVPGYWKCNTKKCHDTFKRTIVGFVRGVLSRQRYGWTYLRDPAERSAQRVVSWREAVDWCCAFLGQTIQSIKVNHGELEKRRFAADVATLTRRPEQGGQGGEVITRSTVRGFLQVPAPYFVARGFSPEILDRYDVGLYPAPNRPLSDRVAVPVYDAEYRRVVGFTGRSVFEACPRCGRHHRGACPAKDDRLAWSRSAKWYNHDFNKESHLYNYWFARSQIREKRTVVLVEGPGDVWRLAEAGIPYAVALFGSELSDEQQVALEMSGAMNVVVLVDTDAAGDRAREMLHQRLRRSFRLHFPKLPSHDVGGMARERVLTDVVPHILKAAG